MQMSIAIFISGYVLLRISSKRERERGNDTSKVKLIKMSSEDGNKRPNLFMNSQATLWLLK